MSASADLQQAVAALLADSGRLPADCAVISRREKELKSDVEAAAAPPGLSIWVMPPLPTRALQAEQPFVFFDSAEVRVRIIEQPAMNRSGADAYDLVDIVALALHWTNPGGILARPLMLAEKPVVLVRDAEDRVFEVIFEAQYQLNN